MRPIVVATAADRGYLPLALVVAGSIQRTHLGERAIEFHILYDGPDNWAIPALERSSSGLVKVIIHRCENPFAEQGKIGGFPPSSFFRYAIPDRLAQYDRAIYIDLDVVVETDLTPLFETELQGNPVAGVPCGQTIADALLDRPHAQFGWLWRDHLRDDIGLDTDERIKAYTQAGVLLLDLEQLRRMHFDKQMARLADDMGDRLAHSDQSALNRLLRDRIAPLDPRWNRTSWSLGVNSRHVARLPESLRGQLQRQRTARGIVHFGGPKPWREFKIPGALSWWKVALMSDARPYVVEDQMRYAWARLYDDLYHRKPWLLQAAERAGLRLREFPERLYGAGARR